MSGWSAALLEGAERRVPGPEFNAVCFELRAEAERAHGLAVLYEVQLDAEQAAEAFAREGLRRLREHLEAKRMNPEGQAGLLVWVWAEGAAHLFSGRRFAEALHDIAPPLALPPP